MRPRMNCLDCGRPHTMAVDLSGLCDACAGPDEVKARRQLEDDHFRARLERSGLPMNLRVDRWPNTPATPAAKAWAEGERPGLVLTGDVGVGKTYLAGIACYRMLHDRPVTWLSAAGLVARLKTGFEDEDRSRALRDMIGTGPLVLDDLDKANPTDFAQEALFLAIDQRVVNGTPLLVTTNLPMSQIGARLGDPIKSRLTELRPIRLVGQDRRLAA